MEVKHLWGMPPKNSGGWTKFPGGHKVIHRTAQTAFVRVVTPRQKEGMYDLKSILFMPVMGHRLNSVFNL